jgi:hypothetical protein
MAYNRSFRFYGIGFSTNPTDAPAEIIATVNGVEVYSGPVASLNDSLRPIQNPYDLDSVMFTLDDSSEFNSSFAGNMPVSITITSGTMVIFTYATANRWGTVPNPAFSTEQYVVLDNPDSTTEEIANVLIASANPPFTAEEEVLLVTLLNAFPNRSDELNDLRQAHNVEYSVHNADSWEQSFTPPAEGPGISPWYITDNLTVDLDIIAFP